MAIWIKKSGQEITLNDREETAEKAKSLGWELKGEPKSESLKKVSKKKVKKVK